MEQAFLSLGSNIGDREENLHRCLQYLRSDYRITVKAVSSFYETKPEGYLHQLDFINAAVMILTVYRPLELLSVVKKIEQRMGRKTTFVNGPRVIDIDIILYGTESLQTAELTIPHPRCHQREFVLRPLREIAPDAAERLYALCK